MKILVFSIFWVVGIVVAFLGNEKLRDYKNYHSPVKYLIIGSVLCATMSWVMVFLLVLNMNFSLPKSIWHNCENFSRISYEEEYLDENGEHADSENFKIHNCYRITKCGYCGKVIERKRI